MKTIETCRLCGCQDLYNVVNFGPVPLANSFKSTPDEKEFEAELAYFKCLNCHSIQLKNEVESEILFSNYLYESPPNLTEHFKELASTCFNELGLKVGDLVVDIGSNNGLLLKQFKALGCEVLGIEPAKNIAQKAIDAGIPTICEFFTEKSSLKIVENLKTKPKLIVSTNCFAHVSDLPNFVEGVKNLLSPEGVFVFENAYLVDTINNLDFGQAYFEHFYMHSVIPLFNFFSYKGLKMFHVTRNKVQMGSIRGFVCKGHGNTKFTLKESVINLILSETLFTGVYPYNHFNYEIVKLRDFFSKKIDHLIKNGKTISVYGWPAKMTLLARVFGLNSDRIKYVVEESSLKIGKFCPGTSLEVKDKKFFEENPTDYCIIGAYNFAEDIKKKNPQYKGIWINPLEKNEN